MRRGSESVSALEGQAWGPPWWGGGMPRGSRARLRETEGGAAGDVGSRVQEALSGFSVKRNSGH